MLLGQNGGGHQQTDLHAVVHRLEGGPQGHLCLAVAHVSADQPIHGLDLLHVGLNLVDRSGLVWGFFEWEGVFQLLLPDSVLAKFVAFGNLARGVEGQQLLGHFPRGALNLLLDPGPLGGPQARKVGRLVLGAHVRSHTV